MNRKYTHDQIFEFLKGGYGFASRESGSLHIIYLHEDGFLHKRDFSKSPLHITRSVKRFQMGQAK